MKTDNMKHVFQIQYQLKFGDIPITNDIRSMFILAEDVIDAIEKLKKEMMERKYLVTEQRGMKTLELVDDDYEIPPPPSTPVASPTEIHPNRHDKDKSLVKVDGLYVKEAHLLCDVDIQ